MSVEAHRVLSAPDVVRLWENFMEGLGGVTKDDVYTAMQLLPKVEQENAQRDIEDIAKANHRRGVTDYTDPKRMKQTKF